MELVDLQRPFGMDVLLLTLSLVLTCRAGISQLRELHQVWHHTTPYDMSLRVQRRRRRNNLAFPFKNRNALSLVEPYMSCATYVSSCLHSST